MRKYILLILAFALMSVGAKAAYAEEKPKALEFAQAVGIISGEKQADDFITREELAESYQYIITNGAQENTRKPTRFTDVFGSSAIDLVDSLGIMSGVDENSFCPGDTVTYVQMITSMIKFLGYDETAVRAGGYPRGYMSVSAQIGLRADGIKEDDPVTAQKAGELFKSAADIGMMCIVYSDGTKQYKVLEEQNYLSCYLRIVPETGIVYGNSVTNLKSEKAMELNQVELNDEIYRTDSDAYDLRDKIGYNVKAYIKTISDDEKHIVYYEEKRNSETRISDSDISDITSDRIEYYDDSDKKAYIKFDKSAYVIYNGTLCTVYDEQTLNPFKNSEKDGYISAIDNNSDGKAEVLYVHAYDSYVVENIINNVIYNKFRSADILDLTDTDRIDIENIVGEPIKFEQIEKNDVICVEKDMNGDIKRIVTGIDRIISSITSYDGSSDEITIGETKYTLSNSMLNSSMASELKAGRRGEFYFNFSGKIFAVDFENYIDYELAYLTNVYDNENFGENDGYTVKLFTKSGVFKRYILAETVDTGNGKVSDKTAVQRVGGVGNNTVRQVVRYKLNGKDEINYMEQCSATNDGTSDGLYRYPGFDGLSSRPIYKSGMGSFGAKLLINSGTIIMEVPDDTERNDEEMYSVKRQNYFQNDSTAQLFSAFGTKKNSAVADIVICENNAVNEISTYANVVVVDKVLDSTNDDGEDIKILCGLINGKPGELSAKPEALLVRPVQYPAPSDSGNQKYELPRRGDALFVSQDGKGVINYAKYVFDYERKNMYFSMGIPVANDRTANPTGEFRLEQRFVFGKVVRMDNDNITVETEGYDETVSYEYYPASKFLLMEYDCSEGRNGVLKAASYTDIRDSERYPGHESEVLVQLRYGDAKCMVIYNGE